MAATATASSPLGDMQSGLIEVRSHNSPASRWRVVDEGAVCLCPEGGERLGSDLATSAFTLVPGL